MSRCETILESEPIDWNWNVVYLLWLQYEGTFDDYLEMFIQFGYVILFSSAYPLAGLCALVNNLIEIRGDAFKLCLVHRRPFGQRVNSIGTWQVKRLSRFSRKHNQILALMHNCAFATQLLRQSFASKTAFTNFSLYVETSQYFFFECFQQYSFPCFLRV